MNVRIWENGFTPQLDLNLSIHLLFPVFLVTWGSGNSCSHLWVCRVCRHPNLCSCVSTVCPHTHSSQACPLTLKPSALMLPTLWHPLHACPLLHQIPPPPTLLPGDTQVDTIRAEPQIRAHSVGGGTGVRAHWEVKRFSQTLPSVIRSHCPSSQQFCLNRFPVTCLLIPTHKWAVGSLENGRERK